MTILGTNMKIKEYDEMLKYLTRSPQIKLPKEKKDEFGYTPSQKKEIEKQLTKDTSKSRGAWKRFVESNKLAEKETPKETWDRLDKQEKVRQKDHLKKLIKFGLEESSKPVIKNPVLREALEPKKSVNYLSDDYSFSENFKKQVNNINDRKKVAKIPVIPPKPDLVNGHSDWTSEDWLESIDPGGWASDEDKRVEANGLYEKYLELLKAGELLPNTTFQMFEKNYLDFDTDVISRINKKVLEQKKKEGLAAIIGVSPGKRI